MTTFSTTAMYSLTVQPPTAVHQAIVGNFTGTKAQQILSASGSRLTLSEVTQDGKFVDLHSHDVFGIIRAISVTRLTGAQKDNIVIASDSGRIITLEYHPTEQVFKKVHSETYGKSGIRRVIAGQYLAVDPKGRAVMVAATEKSKLVYLLTRNAENDTIISSPLSSNKPGALVYDLCALDVNFENPLFAVLETEYTESDADPTGEAYRNLTKDLRYYELDLGLNHVVPRFSAPVDRTANMLFRIPGGQYGPSGVLVCGEGRISYHQPGTTEPVFQVPVPRRESAGEDPNRNRIIVGGTMHSMRRGKFFFLLQTEDGDLFKLTFDVEEESKKGEHLAAHGMEIMYFDTVPVSTGLCILKSGFLYCASESGDRVLYNLEQLGDNTDEKVFRSRDWVENPRPAFFKPRPLRNVSINQTLMGTTPTLGMQVTNLMSEDAPQIYSICGSGPRSTFRISRHALEVLDLVESTLPERGMAVWTVKTRIDALVDSYIVLSLTARTLVLSIGEDVEESQDHSFLKETITLGVQLFGEDCLVQVHPLGIRHIDPDGRTTDWKAPPHRTIVACATNNRQVAIGLSSGEVIYFECAPDGSLAKHQDVFQTGCPISALALGQVPEGRVRTNYLAVGGEDSTVRMYYLSPDDDEHMEQLSVQAVSAVPTALCIMAMKDRSEQGSSLYLHIGLRSGVYIRTLMDEHTGDLSETKRRFIGIRAITFAQVLAKDDPAILIMTSRPWLAYSDPINTNLALAPLRYDPFESAHTFVSPQFKGIIAVMGEDLRIFTFDNLSTKLHQELIDLKYTPKAFASHPEQAIFYVIESDMGVSDPAHSNPMMIDHGESSEAQTMSPQEIGYPRVPGQWSSCIQVVDPAAQTVLQTVYLGQNRCAVSTAVVSFESQSDQTFLAVGFTQDLSFNPLSFQKSGIEMYKILEGGRRLEFYHMTELAAPPQAMLAFKGKLVVGAGTDLYLYDCGLRSLLRKAQALKCASTRIVDLKTQGSRIIVADQRESVTYVVHKDMVHPNRLIPFADDVVPRYTTCTEMVDYDTVAGGDRFGNLWMVRCPKDVSDRADEPNDGQHITNAKGYLGGTPSRIDLVMHFFTNDIPVAVQKTAVIAGGERILFWAGLQGTLGAMIPLESRKDFKMFQQLERLMRAADLPLAGRDHLAYRSYYNPVKAVIDGDLIERFLLLDRPTRHSLVDQIEGGWTVGAVEQKIWTMRGLFVF